MTSGKLIIKDREELLWKDGEVHVQYNDGERKEDFFMTIHKILFIHPGFIFIVVSGLYMLFLLDHGNSKGSYFFIQFSVT